MARGIPRNITNGLKPEFELPDRLRRSARQRPAQNIRGRGSLLQQARLSSVTQYSKKWPILYYDQPSRGLSNPGNFCYRRCTMQSLLHIPQFLDWLKQHNVGPHTCSLDGLLPQNVNCPVCQLKIIANLYWGSGALGVVPPANFQRLLRNFDRAVWHLAQLPPFPLHFLQNDQDGYPVGVDDSSQEDAEEFLRWLLHSVVRQSTANASWQDQYLGLLATTVRRDATCGGCGTRRTTAPSIDEAPILNMTVTSTSLQRCIRDYFRPQTTQQINCQDARCNANTDHSEVTSIRSAPEILIIQLRRTGWDRKKNCAYKITTRVRADQQLDLTTYQEDKSMPLLYELSSVISHAGATMQEGHYIAHTTGPPENHVVTAISDRHCLLSNAATLRRDPKVHTFPPGGQSAPYHNYILFYTRATNTGLYSQLAVPEKRKDKRVMGGRVAKKRGKGKA